MTWEEGVQNFRDNSANIGRGVVGVAAWIFELPGAGLQWLRKTFVGTPLGKDTPTLGCAYVDPEFDDDPEIYASRRALRHAGREINRFIDKEERQIYSQAVWAGVGAVVQSSQASSTWGRFANARKLTDHFTRHGADFAADTEPFYEAQARHFLLEDADPNTLIRIRRNGDVVKYNPVTDEFGIHTPNGTIRTYYRPDTAVHGYATNLDYFNAQ